jgi:hypothetical protein
VDSSGHGPSGAPLAHVLADAWPRTSGVELAVDHHAICHVREPPLPRLSDPARTMSGVDPNAPYWLLILGGAVGGALLTTLANFALKAVDLRHRHDETRRDHYVAMHLAVDNLHQGLLDAVTANNRRTFDGDVELPPGTAGHAWLQAQKTVAVAQDKYNDAMRAYRVLSLFAPGKVMEPLNDALIPMAAVFVRLHHVATVDPGRLPVPEYPHDAVHRFTNAVRKDLGIRNLPLFDNPASGGWSMESKSLGHAVIAQFGGPEAPAPTADRLRTPPPGGPGR